MWGQPPARASPNSDCAEEVFAVGDRQRRAAHQRSATPRRNSCGTGSSKKHHPLVGQPGGEAECGGDREVLVAVDHQRQRRREAAAPRAGAGRPDRHRGRASARTLAKTPRPDPPRAPGSGRAGRSARRGTCPTRRPGSGPGSGRWAARPTARPASRTGPTAPAPARSTPGWPGRRHRSAVVPTSGACG